MPRQVSGTFCSPTSPATRASWPASNRSTGVDFSAGIPAAYTVLGALLDAVIEGLEPDFALVTLEGDAVFAAAQAASLDGQGDLVLERLGAMYRTFTDGRTRALPARDDLCTACPAVTVAHRLLKNTIRSRIGTRPYLFVTDAAASALGLSQVGLAHREEYPDAGQIQGRIVELGEPVRGGVST